MRIGRLPGVPKGCVRVSCRCGYAADVDGEEIKTSDAGYYSRANAWVKCGNPDCLALIPVPWTNIPPEVLEQLK